MGGGGIALLPHLAPSMPASALAWSGGAWTQQGGKWSQKGWRTAWKGDSGEGWQQNSQGWWSQRKQRTDTSSGNGGKGKGQWVGEWVPFSPSQPWSATRSQQQQPTQGEPRAKAAAEVILLEAQIAQLSASPIFDGYRVWLFKDLERAKKLSVDKRTDAKKLLELESWVTRESKRIEADTTAANEVLKSIAQRQITWTADNEALTKLRARIGADGDAAYEDLPEDTAMDNDAAAATAAEAAAEILIRAAQELDMRRWTDNKRKTPEGPELSPEELEQISIEANRLHILQQQKRRNVEEYQNARQRRQEA